MELNGSNVVQMSGQSKHALLGLVAPDFHFVVITSAHEHRLSHVEVDSSHRPYKQRVKISPDANQR